MNNKALKRIVRIALFIALALIMHFVENAIPPLLSFSPGAKMGLANVVSLIALIILGYVDAIIVLVVRCFLASIFGGNVSSLMYSLPAGLCSLLVMIALYHFLFPKISIMALSYAGAIVHNFTQLLVASAIVGNISILYLLPLMLTASIIAGIFVGFTAHYVVKYLPKSVYKL